MKLFKNVVITVILTAIVCCIFCVPSYAEGVEETAIETNVSTSESTIEDNANEIVESAIEILTNTAFLSTVATIGTGALTIILFVIKSINSIKSLISTKADAKTMTEILGNGVKEISDNFSLSVKELNSKLEYVEKALENERDNSKQLQVILSTFILHTKLGTSAKAEILKYIEGLKEYNGTAVEIIECIEEAITKAESEEAKTDTPALDKVCGIALE